MRGAKFLICTLVLAFALAGAGAPLFAADLKSSPQATSPEDDSSADDGPSDEEVAEFCYGQRTMCRKICRLRFRDDDIGCPQNCDSRVSRCMKTGCYKWTEPEFVIAERFGGYRCPSS